MGFDVYGASDVGCVRALNEDSFGIFGFDEDKGGFCVLADGMGGHNAGEVASALAVKRISEHLMASLEDVTLKDIPRRLNRAIEEANAEIFKMSEKNAQQQGMGTTAVVSCICPDIAYVANLGDSRAYAYHGKELYQITIDHSLVEQLVREGSITREEARVHPQKNLITRALGTEPQCRADIFEYEYKKGDVLIMCSDGLSGMLDDLEISEIVKKDKSAEDTAKELIDAAKTAGGRDNITVICIRFV